MCCQNLFLLLSLWNSFCLFFKETIDSTLLTSVTAKETYFFRREKKKSQNAFEDTNAMLFQMWEKQQSSWDGRPGFVSCAGCHGYRLRNPQAARQTGLFSPRRLCTSVS